MENEKESPEVTWPEYMKPEVEKKKERHSWKPQDGFRKDKCTKCGCIRIWDPAYQRVKYYKGAFYSSFKTPDCNTN